jgi:hypothetical protein
MEWPSSVAASSFDRPADYTAWRRLRPNLGAQAALRCSAAVVDAAALPEPAASRFEALAASPRGWRNTNDEYTTLPALLVQARELTDLASAPLVVLNSARHESDAVWNAAQDRMAALSMNSAFGTGHR